MKETEILHQILHNSKLASRQENVVLHAGLSVHIQSSRGTRFVIKSL